MTDRDALDLTTSVTWLAHLIERFANIRLAQANLPDGMSYARANLLLAVASAHADDTSARMVDIALDLGVTGRTLTTMVDSLEKQGLLAREVDPTDRRAFQLLLTDAGRSMLPQIQAELIAAADTVMSPLSASEAAMLGKILNRLIDRS